MNKKLVLFALVLFVPATAFSQNVGRCGWGSKLMDGQKGIAPQVLAATTNGTSGNQTFAITTGTSGCSQNGVVRSSWKTAMFIDANRNKLALDMSRGNGEALESLANLMGLDSNDKARFFELAKSNFDKIFPKADTSTDEVVASIKSVLLSDSNLAKYVLS